MNRTVYLLLLLALQVLSANLSAQKLSSVSGIVLDSENNNLMGNILLLSKNDSSLIKGGFFWEGNFEIEAKLEVGSIVKLSSLGYRDTTFRISEISLDGNLGTIYLKKSKFELGEVSITASRPLIEQSADGITTAHVKNTMLASSNSVHEMLSKLPHLIADEDGITVVGKGEALYYLDGKRVSKSQISALQVNQISEVEIIRNPSARFDAQGNAIINIISIENHAEGFQGKIIQNVSIAKHPKSHSAFNLLWKTGKWSFMSDYGIDFGREWGTNLLTREVEESELNSHFINDYEHNNRSKYVANYRLGTRYDINPESYITLEYYGDQNINEQDSKATTIFTDQYSDETTINATTSGELRNWSNAININYSRILDTLGSNLFMGAQHSGFSSENKSIIEEVILTNSSANNSTRLNQSANNINFSTFQADLTKQYCSGLKMEAGAKVVHAKNTGSVDFYTKEIGSEDFIHSPNLFNDFEYSEYIPAAYFQLSHGFGKKLRAEFGLRGEYTNAEGNSLSLSQTIIDTSYLNIFPNASMQIQLNKKIRLGISYSSAINRPSYQALDPFLFYIDSLTSTTGNPELRPEYTHSFESSLIYKKYVFTAGYTSTNNAFRYAMVQGENGPNSTILKQLNVQSEHSYYGSLTLPVKYKKFQSVNILGITLDKIQDSRPEFYTDTYYPRAYLYSRNSLLIEKVGKIEFNAQYLGTRFDGIYYRKPAFTASFGISRSFFKKALNCSFLVNDLFRSFEVDGYYQLASSKVSYLRKFNTHFYRISISYNFGKLKEFNNNSRKVGHDSEARIRK